MIILGINSSHLATACLLKDGKIVACISEERLTRVKNQSGLPLQSIQECLKVAGLKIEEVDYLALDFVDPKYHLGFTIYQGEKGKLTQNKKLNSTQKVFSLFWKLKEQVLIIFPSSRYIIDYSLTLFYRLFINPKLNEELLEKIEGEIGISRAKVVKVDHHTAHSLSAYYSSPYLKTKPILSFSLDAMGDGVCATVSLIKNGNIKPLATTPFGSSIGDLYAQTTAYLGMSMGEHEYKVMGLAPYSHLNYYKPLLQKLKDLIWVNSNLTFGTKYHSHYFYKVLPQLYSYYRFDVISGALQALTEGVVSEWIKLAIKKTGVSDIVCSGGVFMNVKMNQKIIELNEVKNMFIIPSSGDESAAMGAAYWVYASLKNKKLPEIESLKDLYLGGEFTEKEIKQVLKNKRFKKYKITRPEKLEQTAAKLISEGQVVARFSGRMEFGARSLGNRSILANPSKLEGLYIINEQIKSRDFWMPFAPSILEEDTDKYILNPKKMPAPYMIITFDSTEDGKDKLKAAMHQYDHTIRPQIVYKHWNPSYYELIKEFKKLTGIGAVLNTSFNLHGSPVVYTPEDALHVFENSGLMNLTLGPFLIQKDNS